MKIFYCLGNVKAKNTQPFKQIEEMAMAWEGKEVPDDYVFGVIE